MKRILFSDEAKADIRAIPQLVAVNILLAIHRLAGGLQIRAVKNRKDAYR